MVACPLLLVVFLAARHDVGSPAVARAIAALYFLGVVPGFVIQRYVLRLPVTSPFETMLSSMLLGVFLTPVLWYLVNLAGVALVFGPMIVGLGVAVPLACRWHRGVAGRLRRLVTPGDVPILWVALLVTLVWSYELSPTEHRDGHVVFVTPWGDHCVYASLVGELARGVPPEQIPFIAGPKRAGYHYMSFVWCDLLRRASGADTLDTYFYIALPLRYLFISFACYLALVVRFGRLRAVVGVACMLGFVLYPTSLFMHVLLMYVHWNYPAAFGIAGMFLVLHLVSLVSRGNHRPLLLCAVLVSVVLLWYKANHALLIAGAAALFSAVVLVRRRDWRWLITCLGVSGVLVGMKCLEYSSADLRASLVTAPFAFVEFWWNSKEVYLPIWWESPPLAILGEGTTRAVVDGLPALLRFPAMLGLCLIRSFPIPIGIGLYLVIGCGFARVRSRVQAFDWMAVLLVVSSIAVFVLFPVQKEVMWNVVGPGFSLINALLFALMGPAVCRALRRPYRHGRVVATITTVLLAAVFVWNGFALRGKAFWQTRQKCATLSEPLYACFQHIERSTPTDAVILQPRYTSGTSFAPVAAMVTQRRVVLECGERLSMYYDTAPIMSDLSAFYATADPVEARAILERYQVDYVVTDTSAMRLPAGEALLRPVFHCGEATVFRVERQETASVRTARRG
ncbi:MAG: hypothetical protein JSV19_10330 [Phycisphaerales bacterium]|nr:MAG: hypothetical protein JSV19_10330 [Phycisphaerales bacterium]